MPDSLVDEVEAATPMAGQLAAKVATMERVRPGALGEAARGLSGVGQRAGDSMSAVRGAANALDGVWEGSSADAFAGYLREYAQCGVRLDGALTAVAGVLDRLASTLADQQTRMRNLAENYRRELLPLQQQLNAPPPGAPPQRRAELIALIRQRTIEYAQQADRIIAESNAAVQAAMAQVREQASGPGPFTTLPPPEPARCTPRTEQPVDLPEAVPGGRDAPDDSDSASGSDSGSSSGSSSGGSSAGGSAGSGGSSGSDGSDGSGGSGGSSGSDGSSGSGGTGRFAATSSVDVDGSGADGPAKSAEAAGSEGSVSEFSSGPPGHAPKGNVDGWIREAIGLLQQNGYPVTEQHMDEIRTIIEHESGGDPKAINDWDSNAAKGTPSKGLMQTIDPTFDAHALPGHTDVWNPVDNIAAGVAYTYDRYGSLEEHPGIESIAKGGGYKPY